MNTTQTNVSDFQQPVNLGMVSQLPAMVRKITTTAEGKLQVIIEADALDSETISKVKGLLEMQQGLTLIDFTPAQGDLFTNG